MYLHIEFKREKIVRNDTSESRNNGNMKSGVTMVT
jgi:hypothetical protein